MTGHLAEQYAALCEKTNERLRRCEQYLRNAMRTEALHLAEIPPSVMEQAAALDFYGVEAWRDFCRRSKRLVVAHPIAAEVVSWLNRSYIHEESLSDVLAEFRKLAHRGTLPQKISLLRRLVKLDVENTDHWREDLRKFERARLAQLAKEARGAMGANNLKTMEALRDELTSPDRLVQPDQKLLKQLEKQIHHVRLLLAQAKGKHIAHEAWDAFSAFDFARVATGLSKWEALIAEGYFKPDEDLEALIVEVRQWFDAEQEKREQDRDFRRAVSQLIRAVDSGASRSELERRRRDVEKHHREIPKQLRLSVDRAIEDARISEQQTKRLIIVGSLGVVLLVAVITFLMVRSTIVKRRRAEWDGLIAASFEKGDPRATARLLNNLKERHPRLAQSPPFPAWEKRIKDDLEAVEKEEKQFSKILEKLEGIQDAGFQGPYAPLERSAALLRRTKEDDLRFQEYVFDRKEHEAREQDKLDAIFTGHMDVALEKLVLLARLNPEKQNDAYRKALDEAYAEIKAARALKGVSEQPSVQLPALIERLQRHAAMHGEARERLVQQRKMLAEINAALPDLGQYEEKLRLFVEQFPTHSETARFNRIIDDCRWAKDLQRGAEWEPPFDEETSEKVKQFLELPEARQSMWRDSLEWERRRAGADSPVSEVVQNIRAFRENPLFHSLRLLEYTDPKSRERHRYYYIDEPQKFSDARTRERVVNDYLINVFGENDQPEAKAVRVPFDIPTDPSATLAPHCKWLNRVFAGILSQEPHQVEAFLLQNVEDLRTSPDVEPIVKALFMQKFLEEVRRIALANGAEIDKMRTRLEFVETNVNWRNPSPDSATQQARQTVQKLLPTMTGLPSMIWRTKIQNSVHRAALSRKPRCVGQVKGNNGDLRIDVRGFAGPELWVAAVGDDGAAEVHIVALARRGAGFEIQPSAKDLLYPGLPVFAPTDGKRTADVLDSILKNVPNEQAHLIQKISWPACWPVNARQALTAGRGRTDGDS